MAKYIDADAFVKNMSEIKESTLQNHSLKRGNEPIDGYDADFLRAIGLAKQLVDEFPATYFRPNVKGEWLKSKIPNEMYVCSCCGGACWRYDSNGLIVKSNYCPNCGADMRG